MLQRGQRRGCRTFKRQKEDQLTAKAVRRLGAERGHAIRKQVTQIHLLAPSLVNQPTAVIEKRLREEEAGILAQSELLNEGGARRRAVD